MKFWIMIGLLATLVSCDPFRLGYDHNPAYILDSAVKSIENLDVEGLREVLAKEAYCVYGNEQGVHFLKEKLPTNYENIRPVLKEISNTHHSIPNYVGYWSYLTIRYRVEVQDKRSSEILLGAIIDCDFGIEGEKDDKWLNRKYSRYKKKECKVVKLIPNKLSVLMTPSSCQNLMVVL
jgi:hypothetical protein